MTQQFYIIKHPKLSIGDKPRILAVKLANRREIAGVLQDITFKIREDEPEEGAEPTVDAEVDVRIVIASDIQALPADIDAPVNSEDVCWDSQPMVLDVGTLYDFDPDSSHNLVCTDHGQNFYICIYTSEPVADAFLRIQMAAAQVAVYVVA